MSRNKVPRRFAKHGPPGDTQLIWRKGAEKSSEKVPVPTFVHALSADRFDTYLKWAGADQTLAERLYTYNVQLSAALYGPLHMLEVVLRNMADARLAAQHGAAWIDDPAILVTRSEEHTSELQSLMRISYAVFCL